MCDKNVSKALAWYALQSFNFVSLEMRVFLQRNADSILVLQNSGLESKRGSAFLINDDFDLSTVYDF